MSIVEENYSEVVRGKVPKSLKKRVLDYGARKLMQEAEIVRQAVREYIERAERQEEIERRRSEAEMAGNPTLPARLEDSTGATTKPSARSRGEEKKDRSRND